MMKMRWRKQWLREKIFSIHMPPPANGKEIPSPPPFWFEMGIADFNSQCWRCANLFRYLGMPNDDVLWVGCINGMDLKMITKQQQKNTEHFQLHTLRVITRYPWSVTQGPWNRNESKSKAQIHVKETVSRDLNLLPGYTRSRFLLVHFQRHPL